MQHYPNVIPFKDISHISNPGITHARDAAGQKFAELCRHGGAYGKTCFDKKDTCIHTTHFFSYGIMMNRLYFYTFQRYPITAKQCMDLLMRIPADDEHTRFRF